ncbi:unnamed protein product [Brassica oleracea var. botrytis]|uniref:Uncharacterized protein n=3 Tax=Brassica TaxID=3705 RepID=A0A0D3APJ9_BRAOL|nr:unnamed protein product [Brassica napus]CDY42996.1 BnaC02g19700D [Brassica napus]VDD22618.1 unnamed protein product [Brassica oleracea]
MAAITVYLTVSRPRDSVVLRHNRQGPLSSVANSSVSFTYSQFSSVRNSNLTAFSHYKNRI